MAKKNQLAKRLDGSDEPEPEAKTYASREEALDLILNKVEALLVAGVAKPTIADYLRLIQVRKEMVDERPREIEITWVNSLAGDDSSDG